MTFDASAADAINSHNSRHADLQVSLMDLALAQQRLGKTIASSPAAVSVRNVAAVVGGSTATTASVVNLRAARRESRLQASAEEGSVAPATTDIVLTAQREWTPARRNRRAVA